MKKMKVKDMSSLPQPTQNLTDLVHNITNLNHFNRSYLVYEDDQCLALHNYLNPVTPLHILILPKKRLRTLAEMTEVDKSMIGNLLLVAHRIGTNFTQFGYRLCINQGEFACEDYGVVMFHLMGQYQFSRDLGFNERGLHLIYTLPDYEFRESDYWQLK